jgi:hypothetical protein
VYQISVGSCRQKFDQHGDEGVLPTQSPTSLPCWPGCSCLSSRKDKRPILCVSVVHDMSASDGRSPADDDAGEHTALVRLLPRNRLCKKAAMANFRAKTNNNSGHQTQGKGIWTADTMCSPHHRQAGPSKSRSPTKNNDY